MTRGSEIYEFIRVPSNEKLFKILFKFYKKKLSLCDLNKIPNNISNYVKDATRKYKK